MAMLISTLFISLDGVVEIDPEWHFPYFDDEMGAAVGQDYADVDVLLLGRVTYNSFAGAWPERETSGEADASFAKQLGDTRKVVVTHKVAELGWRNAEPIAGDLLEAVAALKSEPGVSKILLAGSTSVTRQLLAGGLIDEIRLFVHPVAARHGERLFDEGEPLYPLNLISSQVFPRGVIKLVYTPTFRRPVPAA